MRKIFLLLAILVSFSYSQAQVKCLYATKYRRLSGDKNEIINSEIMVCFSKTHVGFYTPKIGSTSFLIQNPVVAIKNMYNETDSTMYSIGGYYSASVTYGEKEKTVIINLSISGVAYMFKTKDFESQIPPHLADKVKIYPY